MKILEIRDGFIKLESAKKSALSSFIQIKDINKTYIAQVILSKADEDMYTVYAKILFLYDGSFKKYDNTTPRPDSEVDEFSFDILNNYLDSHDGVKVGEFIDNKRIISLDKNTFLDDLLVCCDDSSYTKIIINNLYKQQQNSIVIDMQGSLNGDKYIAGKDFKLPLNSASLEFLYEDCLNDATSASKDLIKEIFKDLSEYSQNVTFLPFKTLKDIVDCMVDKQHIFKLLVLKNKLASFDKLGYFASGEGDVNELTRILRKGNVILDLSKLEPIFQCRYLQSIYSCILSNKIDATAFVLPSLSINQNTLRSILGVKDIGLVFFTNHKFKYIDEIKSLFKNYIIVPSLGNNNTFKAYSAFLNSMNKNNCLVVGEGTKYIPLVSTITDVSPQVIESITDENIDTPEAAIVATEAEEIESVDDAEEIIDITSEEKAEAEAEAEVMYSNPQINAVDKKSEDFIDKISEEIHSEAISEKTGNLFEDNESEDEIISNEIEDEEQPEASDLAEEVTEDLDNIPNAENLSQTIEEEPQAIQLTEEDLSDSTDSEEIIVNPSEADLLLDAEETPSSEEISLTPEELNESREYSTEIHENIDSNSNIEEIETNTISDEKLSDSDFEIVELDTSESNGADIIVDIDDSDEKDTSDSLDQEIAEDVDKVFTTYKEDSISDSDLDFIDELNSAAVEDSDLLLDDNVNQTEVEEIAVDDNLSDLEELITEDDQDQNDGLLEPMDEIKDYEPPQESKEILETKNVSTPIVPVYDAEIPQEDLVSSDDIEQGDTVVHAKYGTGVVEKMIKYGTKNLFSINFDNVGRRLLDPTLTEIKKA